MTMSHFNECTKIRRRVSDILLVIGIMPSLEGYKFIVKGVSDCIENPDLLRHMTRILYPKIAAEFGRTPTQVERCIRHAIELAWNRGKFIKLNDIFRVNVIDQKEKYRPQNGEFLALLADRVLLEFAEQKMCI